MAEAQFQTTGQAAPPQPRRVTVAEFFELYGDKPYQVEVIDGEIVEMSPTQRDSERPTHRLYDSLKPFVVQNQLGEVWIESTYVLEADDRTDWVLGSRQPDVSFISRERIAAHDAKHGTGGPWRLAPDLAVEVISPTDKYSDVLKKVADYLRYGVWLIWLVDPQNRTVQVYTPDTPNGILLRDDATLTGDPILPGWSMPLAALFGEQ
jgi:Uma2 family endonuclease